jgi:hypothetical protein
MKIYTDRTIQFIFIIADIFLLCSCFNDEYHSLSEKDKKYLFYNKGDTLLFMDKKDTLYGYVTEKKIEVTSGSSSYYSSGNYIHTEKGILRICRLGDSTKEIVFISMIINGSVIEITYEFANENLNRKYENCYDRITFDPILKNGELAVYDGGRSKIFYLEPINTDIYELEDSCQFQKLYKLQISKSDGFKVLIFNKSDSLFISKL